jgi:hypothetical protein
MHRVRSKHPLSAARSGKSLALSKGHAKDGTSDVPHDPLANLRKVEASRPGFHFRGTESLDFLVYGRRQAHESKRSLRRNQRSFRLAGEGRRREESDCFRLCGRTVHYTLWTRTRSIRLSPNTEL